MLAVLKDFRKFILRGNVVDLAVAVSVGTAFTAIVTSLTKYLITPLVAAIAGNKTNFSSYSFTINKSVFEYGQVINAVISFLVVSAVVFFLIVKPVERLNTLSKRNKDVEPTEKVCPECLSTIPIKATRCAFCTAKLKPQREKPLNS
jgi:large conductance mechanosensitive channel